MDRKKREKMRANGRPRLACVLVALMTYVLLFGMLVAAARPEQYDLRVGQVSPITITATKDVEDTVTTQQLIDIAVAAVQPNYVSDTTVMPQVMQGLEDCVRAMAEIRALGPLPESEMAEVHAFDRLPENLTYPGITPVLAREVLASL